MYCPSCGKQIADESKFCLYCGALISNSSTVPPGQKVSDWEYTELILNWPPGYTGWLRADVYPEPAARLNYWQIIQAEILPALQLMHDEGWQPVTEIGPSCIRLRQYKSLEGTNWFWVGVMIAFTWGIGLLFLPFLRSWKFQMIGFYLKLRRPKGEASLLAPENIVLDWNSSRGEFVPRQSPMPSPSPPPTPPESSGSDRKRSPWVLIGIILIVVTVVMCCCSMLAWRYGDIILYSLGIY